MSKISWKRKFSQSDLNRISDYRSFTSLYRAQPDNYLVKWTTSHGGTYYFKIVHKSEQMYPIYQIISEPSENSYFNSKWTKFKKWINQ